MDPCWEETRARRGVAGALGPSGSDRRVKLEAELADDRLVGSTGIEISDEVRLACLDQVNRSVLWAGIAGPAGAILLVFIFGHTLPWEQTVAWATTVAVVNLVSAWIAALYLRKRRRNESVGRWPLGPVTLGLTGLAWGSLPFFVFVPVSHYDLRAIYLIVLCAASAANAIGAAARRSYFLPFQLALMLPVDLFCLLAHDRSTQLLGLAIPVFLVVMIVLHRQVHRLVLSELRLREHNGEVNKELLVLNAQLGEIALRDGLTGAANRVAFVDALSHAISESRMPSDCVGVVFLDLDRFKVVNDSLGHQAGDELLVQVSDRIRGVLRQGDVLARLGGDEFTVLLTGLKSSGEVLSAARRIHSVIEDPFLLFNRSVLITASIGVTASIGTPESPQDLLRQADLAQYRAKEDGGNRVEAFVPILHPVSRRRLDNEQSLREGLANGQIVAHFQPQIDLRSGQVVGAEALARWMHPEFGLLGAADFISLAEDSDLILHIDAAVRRSAIEARVALAEAGCDPAFRMWCNVSSRQLTTLDPVGDLLDDLHRAKCEPLGFGVEIAEGAVSAHADAAVHHINRIRRHGVQVSLDDFGTGQSSLALLRSLSVDELKVDREFISDIDRDDRHRAVVKALMAMGKDLGLAVVAEGVETLDQAALLADLRCDRAQGFLWASPAPLVELLSVVRTTFPVRAEADRVGQMA
jgi:diguanylate cyclase (GGDEF)-like protein